MTATIEDLMQRMIRAELNATEAMQRAWEMKRTGQGPEANAYKEQAIAYELEAKRLHEELTKIQGKENA